jgi:hypothetical protein
MQSRLVCGILMSNALQTPSDLTWHGDARDVVDAVIVHAVSRGI